MPIPSQPSYHSVGAIAALTLMTLTGVASAKSVPLGSETVADVAEKVTPAVVNIATERTTRGRHPMEDHPFFREFFGPNNPRQPRREVGAGSGVVISPDGYIVTNNHVIEGADSIKVIFPDKSEYKAKLVGTDKPSDVALIKIKGKNLPHLKFGDSSKLRLGEFVLAIGNPFGVGQTLTMGIVSAKGRANIGIVEYEDFIQTDAAINPGNSGGALVNLKGQLVGINTAILSRSGGAHGIGFAVPSNMVRPILDQVKNHGRVRRGWLGVVIQDLTPDLASSLGIKERRGVLVSDVADGGPADKAKLKAGDVVTSVNGKKTRTSAQLKNVIALLGPGTSARLEILRDGKTSTIKVRLDEKPDGRAAAPKPQSDESLFAGLELGALDAETRRKLDAPAGVKGALVRSVTPGSLGEAGGLRPGDVIVRADKRNIRSPKDLRSIGPKKDRVLLRVWRRGSYLFVVLKR